MPATIRSRLLLFVLSVLLPGLLAVGLVIASAINAEREANERTLRETARAMVQAVDGELARRARLARVLALSSLLDDGAAISEAALTAFARQASGALLGLEGWVELRAPGRLLLDTRWPPGPRPPGTVEAKAWATTTQLLPLQPGGGSAQAHAALVEPVQRNGQTVLNLVVTLRPAEMQQLIDRQRLPADRINTVLDSTHVVVARHPGGAAYAGRQATGDLVARLSAGKEGLFESVTLDGVHATTYHVTGEMGWAFVSAMRRDHFAGWLSDAVLELALGALALLALAVAAALMMARRLVAPVLALKGAATQLQSGAPVVLASTGIAECDDVAVALAEASRTLAQGRTELEQQVAQAVDRTRQAEQRMAQSRRVEALGRLTGGVAHDFNNLLGVISNSAHLIKRHASTPDTLLPLAATLRAVEIGSRLTQHLLRFAGQRTLRVQQLELARYLPEWVEQLRSLLGQNTEISVHVEADTQPVQVDTGELELALMNVALNARDAMPTGGELRLRAHNADAEDTEGLPAGRWVLISVGDNGPGMASELAESVFEPFFTTKPTGKGTGLGLSQVHGFCVQAGGAARIASTPGVGTTVVMLLPAAVAGEPPAEPAAEAAAAAASAPAHAPAPAPAPASATVPAPSPALQPPSAPSPTSLTGVRVLLVEDNSELAEVTADLLAGHHATVERAADAGAALLRLDRLPAVDVVLSDVVMPGPLNGLALARRLRRERPQLPVVLISGFPGSEDAARDFEVLRKPCTPAELVAALQRALARRTGAV